VTRMRGSVTPRQKRHHLSVCLSVGRCNVCDKAGGVFLVVIYCLLHVAVVLRQPVYTTRLINISCA